MGTDKVLFIAIMDQTAEIDPLTDALVICVQEPLEEG